MTNSNRFSFRSRSAGINRQVELYIVDGNNENQFRLGVNEHGALLKVVSELDRDKYKVSRAITTS